MLITFAAICLLPLHPPPWLPLSETTLRFQPLVGGGRPGPEKKSQSDVESSCPPAFIG